MPGRHDYLARIITIAMFMSLVLPAVLPLVEVTDGAVTVDASGNITVDGASVLVLESDLPKYGNIVVNGGTLIMRNMNVVMRSDYGLDTVPDTADDNIFSISITNSGKLFMDNVTITSEPVLIAPHLPFEFTIDNSIMMANESTLAYPGWFNVTNSAEVFLNNSIVTSIDNRTDITVPGIFEDYHDDAPRVTVDDASLILADTEIWNAYDIDYTYTPGNYDTLSKDADPTGAWHTDDTVAGTITDLQDEDGNVLGVVDGEVVAIDTFTSPVFIIPTAANIIGYNNVRLNVIGNTTAGYNGTNTLNWSTEGGSWTPTGFNPGQGVTFNEPVPLFDPAFVIYNINTITNLNVKFENNGNATEYVNFDVIEILVDPVYGSGINLIGTAEFTMIGGYLDIDLHEQSLDTDQSWKRLHLQDTAEAHLYGVMGEEITSPAIPGIFVDLLSPNAFANIYGMIDVEVKDEAGDYLDGADVTTEWLPNGGGAAVEAYVDAANTIAADDYILAYMDRINTAKVVTSANYDVTDTMGSATIPVLTNIINNNFGHNGHPISPYNLTVTKGGDTFEGEVHFDTYPEMSTMNSIGAEFNITLGPTQALNDLEVLDTSISPPTPIYGDLVTVYANITNTGTKGIVGDIEVTFTNGTEMVYANITDLAGGATKEVSTSFIYEPGMGPNTSVTRNVMVDIDTPDMWNESDETDNSATVMFTVNSHPNLRILSFTPAGPGIYPVNGDNINLDATIILEGGAPGNVEVTYYLGDPTDGGLQIGTETVAVTPFATATSSQVWASSMGSHGKSIYVVVDALNTWDEQAYENDNMDMSSLYIYDEPYDLVVDTETVDINTGAVMGVSGRVLVLPAGILNVNGGIELLSTSPVFTIDGGTLNLDGSIVSMDAEGIAHSGTFELITGTFVSTGGELIIPAIISGSSILPSTNFWGGTATLADTIFGYTMVSGGTFDATSCTFDKDLEIGGNTVARLENVTTPLGTIIGDDTAAIDVWWHLTVNAVDNSSALLPGVDITAEDIVNTLNPDVLGTTNAEGMAVLTLFGSTWVGDVETHNGSFYVDGVHGIVPADMGIGVVMESSKNITLSFGSIDPDPLVFGITQTFPAGNPLDGSIMYLEAELRNAGFTDTNVTAVLYIDGPDDITGDEIERLEEIILVPYVAPGDEYVWNISVDTTDLEGNHDFYVVLEDIISDENWLNNMDSIAVTVDPAQPDFVVNTITFNPAGGDVVGSTVQITAEIGNTGTIDVIGTIRVRAYDETTSEQIQVTTISGLAAGSTKNAYFNWLLEAPVSAHTINITADSIGDYDELNDELTGVNNNYLEAPYNVNGKANLTITDADLNFNVTAPMIGDSVQISIDIYNHGQADIVAENIDVEFWVGGSLLQTDNLVGVSIAQGASIPRTYDWDTTGAAGEQTITVIVKAMGFSESFTTDNSASQDIIVYRPTDLIVDNSNSPVTISNPNYPLTGFVLVKESGVLNIVGSTLDIVQNTNNKYNMIVQDTGTIRFTNGGSLSTDQDLEVFLRDSATFEMTGGTIDAQADIIADIGTGITINLMDVALDGDLASLAGVTTTLTAVNTTFSNQLDEFMSDSHADLTNCYIPHITLYDTATIDVRVWVEVMVEDANGQPVAGAIVEPREHLSPLTVVDGISMTTGTDGKVLMALQTYILTAPLGGGSGGVEPLYVANYEVNVTFDAQSLYGRGGIHEVQDFIDLGLPSWLDSVNEPVPTVHTYSITLSDIKPDLDPPVGVTEESIPKYGNTIIWSQVWNNGTAPADQLMVRFNDTTTGMVIDEVTLTSPLGVNEWVWVNTSMFDAWMIGTHTIQVDVNPTDGDTWINETSMADNTNTTSVEVYGLADLWVWDITFSQDDPTEGTQINIHAEIYNSGDVDVIGYSISAYRTALNGSQVLLGTNTNKSLSEGAFAQLTVGSWQIPETGVFGLHDIYVVIDVDDIIVEYNEWNNNLSHQLNVLRRAELSILPGAVYSTQENISDGESITLQAIVNNEGGISTSNIEVEFFIDANANGINDAGETTIGTAIVKDTEGNTVIAPSSNGIAEFTWVAGSDQPERSFNIGAIVNPSANTPANEYDWTNNFANATVTVTLTRDIVVSLADIVPAQVNETLVTVTARVESRHQDSANVLVYLYEDINKDGTLSVVEIVGEYTIDEIKKGTKAPVTFTWNAMNSSHNETHLIYVYANPNNAINETQMNNSRTPYSLFDPRSDLEIIDANFTASPQEGVSGIVYLNITNNGRTSAENFQITIIDEFMGVNRLMWNSLEGLYDRSDEVAPGEYLNITLPLILIGVGDHNISFEVDSIELEDDTIMEFNESNNVFLLEIEVATPLVTPNLYLPDGPFVVGNNMEITGGMVPQPANLSAVTITISIYQGSELVGERVTTPDAFNYNFNPPTAGTYTIDVEVEYEGTVYTASRSFDVADTHEDQPIPLWIILLIIVIIIVPIVVVTAYLYKYGLGTLVECGECSSLIPMGSGKCPKCGVEFEPDTAKCSVCGSWLSVDASLCPECGAEFSVAELSPEEYKGKMQRQYNEHLVPYRTKAAEELDVTPDTMTDEQFEEWWSRQPEYISFENWLSMEEEKRAAIKPVLCPECESLNPSGAATCYKCGMNLSSVEEGEAKAKPKNIKPTPVEEKEQSEAPKEIPPTESASEAATLSPEEIMGTQPTESKPAEPKQVVTRKVVAGGDAKKVVVQKPVQQVVTRKVVAKPQVVTKKVVQKPGEEDKT